MTQLTEEIRQALKDALGPKGWSEESSELAPHVEVDLDQMRADTQAGRGKLPFIFGSMRRNAGVDELVSFLTEAGGLTVGS